MELSQEQQRRAASNEFFQCLNQLEDILEVGENQGKTMPEALDSSSVSDHQVSTHAPIDLEALEEAAADIEQYLKKNYEL
ncbi:MAG: hypothetical protein DSM106950_32430 [Stigonema ocellatum SAG 48.90 = DSM 106950]|nr:hypothetical protein [Stigonema ocellatum SAG 48.90 = DSM 106950]